MPLNATSLAAAVASSVKNVQFQPTARNIPRKILIIATYDPAITTITDEVPQQVLSAEDAGAKFGFGFMAHRLAVQAFVGSNGVETWIQPQAEVAGTQSEGTITFTAVGVLAGTVYLYIDGLAGYIPFTVADGDDATAVADACVAAINAIKELSVTAANTLGVVTITSKTSGLYGDDISIKLNLRTGEELPTGVSAVIVAMTGGAGTPNMVDALDGLGTGDDANEQFFTDVVHGYGQVTAVLDAVSAYVGAGNDFLGLYSKTVARPFRALTGDVEPGSGAFTALVALGNGRKLDRANGVISVPDSANHPAEIAAQTIGIMARINIDVAAQHYIGIPLIDIDPGAKANRWTSQYDNRDNAVKAGVSPTRIQSGVVTLQNIVTFYHPDNVPVESNGYRSMRNISILQNILENVRINFDQEKWQGISIVEDVVEVSSVADRLKARDVDAVIDDLTALARAFESKAWIYTASFTIEELNKPDAVEIRPGGLGFNNSLSIILSGEGGIFDTVSYFDTSLAILFK